MSHTSAIGHNAGDKRGSDALYYSMHSGQNNVKKTKPPVFQATGAHIAHGAPSLAERLASGNVTETRAS